jgi:hypothetical protein
LRRLLLLLVLLLAPALARAQFPSPTFASVNVQNNHVIGGTLTVSGTSSLNGGGNLTGTFGGPTILSSVQPIFTNKTIATLPSSASPGAHFWVTDCSNGGDGAPTGCDYRANDNGALIAQPYPPAGTVVVIGGQSLLWGGSTTNQGNGTKILTCTGNFVTGNAVTTNAAGACVDSGVVPSGGSGGAGTVTNCATNGLPAYYPAAGTSLGCPTALNNSLWGSNGSGVLTAFTTLPSTLIAPSWVLSNPNITGTATVAAETLSGALTLAASVAGGANFNCTAGTAPTSPVNNNVWCTSTGMFDRFGGVTTGPFIDLTKISGSGAISYNNTTGVFTCPNCLLGSAGGTLTSPDAGLVISGATIHLGTTIIPIEMLWDGATNVTAQTYPLPDIWPWATGTIDSVTYHTGGTSTPSFGLSAAINGTPITNCTGITVSSATDTTSNCTALNTITTGQHLTIATSSIVGTPNNAIVQINAHHSNP